MFSRRVAHSLQFANGPVNGKNPNISILAAKDRYKVLPTPNQQTLPGR